MTTLSLPVGYMQMNVSAMLQQKYDRLAYKFDLCKDNSSFRQRVASEDAVWGGDWECTVAQDW